MSPPDHKEETRDTQLCLKGTTTTRLCGSKPFRSESVAISEEQVYERVREQEEQGEAIRHTPAGFLPETELARIIPDTALRQHIEVTNSSNSAVVVVVVVKDSDLKMYHVVSVK